MLLKALIVCCLLLCGQLLGQQVNPTSDLAAASELVIPLAPIAGQTNSALTAMLAAVNDLKNEGISTELAPANAPAILVIRGVKEEEKLSLMRTALKLDQSLRHAASSIPLPREAASPVLVQEYMGTTLGGTTIAVAVAQTVRGTCSARQLRCHVTARTQR